MSGTRRRAKVRLNEPMLATMLDLPDSNRVIGLQARMDPFGVEVIIEGPDLPEVPPDAEAPFVHVQYQARSDGRLGLTLIWPDAESVPKIGDTCCGKCDGGTCYVDQVTGA